MKIANIYPIPAEIGNVKPKYKHGFVQGGGETEPLNLSESLSLHDHQVTFYTGKHHGVKVTNQVLNNNLTVKYLRLFFSKDSTISLSLELFLQLCSGKFDVIQSYQLPIMFSLIGAIAAKLSGAKSVVVFCGKKPITKLQKFINFCVSYLADAIIVQNEYTKKIVQKFAPENKLKIIPYCINDNFFKKNIDINLQKKYKKDNNFIIISVCRLIPAKGIDVIIQAVYNLVHNKHMSNIELVIVGTGPSLDDLTTLVKNLKLEEHIHFEGYVPIENLPKYYSLADLFILASTEHYHDGTPIIEMCETFGLVLAEAMSCGTPVIASKIGGISNWIKDYKNGLLFNERDQNQLSEKIVQLATNYDLRKNLINNALEDIKTHYSYKAVANQYSKFYIDLYKND